MAEPRHTNSAVLPDEITIDVDWPRFVRRLMLVAVGCELLFLVLDYFVNYGNPDGIGALRRLTNLAREDGFGSWFGTTQTMMIALTLWLCFLAVRGRVDAPLPRWHAWGWGALAAFFSYMAIDDGAQLHERIGTLVYELSGKGSAGPSWFVGLVDIFPSYYWQLVFLPIFGSVAVLMIVFLWRVLDRRLLLISAAGVVCFVVAVGMDFIEGLGASHPYDLHTLSADGLGLEAFAQRRFAHTGFDSVRHFSKTLEETVEMFGQTLLWYVFLTHVGNAARDLRVDFGSGDE